MIDKTFENLGAKKQKHGSLGLKTLRPPGGRSDEI